MPAQRDSTLMMLHNALHGPCWQVSWTFGGVQRVWFPVTQLLEGWRTDKEARAHSTLGSRYPPAMLQMGARTGGAGASGHAATCRDERGKEGLG